MIVKKYRVIIEVLVLSFLVYVAHTLFFSFQEAIPKYKSHYYSLETLYGFFSLCSTIIILVLIKIKEKNIDSVGLVFLWLTCIKMGLAYTLLYPILTSDSSNIEFEKLNFFVIFALFLTIETVLTVRILNNKQ
jgi:hypothetical protein